MHTFNRLVRFTADDKPHFGELLEFSDGKYKIQRYQGNPFDELQPTEDIHYTDTLLSPLESTPIIQCIGLNYRQHAEESKSTVPTYPPVFTKPADALAGPFERIEIHPDAQKLLDYEGELTVVIGRDAKNVTAEAALDYVLGYTVGNDVSARNFQLPEASGGQFCYAKSFDRFGPIGPAIVHPRGIPDPQQLQLITFVNGAVKQSTSTSDMIWGVREIIAHLSRGTTLRQGTVIMTGTPSGVGLFRREFLKHGDVVEVDIAGVGRIGNTVHFA